VIKIIQYFWIILSNLMKVFVMCLRFIFYIRILWFSVVSRWVITEDVMFVDSVLFQFCDRTTHSLLLVQ
jgi:hypothetical protein